MLKSLKEKRAKLITDAQQLVAKKDVTTEDRAKAHAMLADVDLLEQDIAIEERAAKLADEQRSAGRPPRAQPGEGTTLLMKLAPLRKLHLLITSSTARATPEC
jgi:hypothetical protein